MKTIPVTVTLLQPNVVLNGSRGSALQSQVNGQQSKINTLQTDNNALQNKLQCVSFSGTEMCITGANLIIRSGSGYTNGSLNGLVVS